jgi:hypothetical protein
VASIGRKLSQSAALEELPLPPYGPSEISIRLQAEQSVPLGDLSATEIVAAFEIMESEMRGANRALRSLRSRGQLDGGEWEDACAVEDFHYQRYNLAVRRRCIPRAIVERIRAADP